MEDLKRVEIKQHIVEQWDIFDYKNELAADVKMKYIFGPYANNEHWNIDAIWEIVQEVEAEKNTPIVEEPEFIHAMMPDPSNPEEAIYAVDEDGWIMIPNPNYIAPIPTTEIPE